MVLFISSIPNHPIPQPVPHIVKASFFSEYLKDPTQNHPVQQN